MKQIIFTACLFAFCGCSLTSNTSEYSYESIIEKYSDRKELHQGFINVLQMHGTVLNSVVQKSQIQKKSLAFQWNTADVQTAMVKMDEILNSQTVIFLSFFSPTPKVDDLDKIQSIWKIYLDVNGKRYEGKAVKQSGVYDEFLELYPYHTRFGTPYKIIFNVSALNIEKYPMELTVTGTLGKASLHFPGI